jgi:sec-independent protein translocase protein TatA
MRGALFYRRFAQLGDTIVFGLGATELLIILAIVVVLFGARRLPEIGSGLGKAIKNFKTGISGKDEIDVTPTKPDEVSDRGGPQA